MALQFLIVFLGGGLGSAGRHGINLLAGRFIGSPYPFGTLLINLAGSFAMGAVVEYFALRSGMSAHQRLFLTTGILGGFTTFSTFALETVALLNRGESLAGILYATGSVVLGVAALFLGMAWVSRFFPS